MGYDRARNYRYLTLSVYVEIYMYEYIPLLRWMINIARAIMVMQLETILVTTMKPNILIPVCLYHNWIYALMLFDGVRINTLRPRQNGRHFADDILNCIFLNENVWISFKISLKFVPKGLINNIASLVQIMAWRRPGAKPLSEPMMVSLLTHICVTRPQWVNNYLFVFTCTFRNHRMTHYDNIPAISMSDHPVVWSQL